MSNTSYSTRERLLEVIRILQDYSDEESMLGIDEIYGHLPENAKVGMRGVRDDIQALEESNVFPVTAVQEKAGMRKHYYYDGRLFEIHELRLLMDAIAAAKFIPQKETNRLFMKIRKLTSQRLAKQLMNELYVTDKMDDNVEEVTAFVQLLHEAIQAKQHVTFQYGRYGTDLKFNLSNDGNDYEITPLGLVWNRDRYYLIAHFIPEDEIRQYRVDRMRNVRVLDEVFVPDPSFDLHEHVKNMFHMFGGETISFEAEFSDNLINVIIDRFGLDANIESKDNGVFVLKSQVAMSEGFVRWLLRWGSDVKVLHPPALVERMKDEIEKLAHLYR